MTEQEIFTQLKELIRKVLGTKLEDIKLEKNLVSDLGAESIDLLDLSFLIEDTFKVTIAPNEFEMAIKKALPNCVYEKDGIITDEALEELRKILPEVDQTKLVRGLRKNELPSLLTVGVFVRLIHKKLLEQQKTDISDYSAKK